MSSVASSFRRLAAHSRQSQTPGKQAISPYSTRIGSPPKIPPWVAVPTGISAGVLGSLCGIGGGVVIIPSLASLTAMTPHAVSAASIFCVSVSSMTGAVSYLEQGFTNVPLALTLMLTSIPGAAIGARLTAHVSGALLKKLSGAAMLSAAPAIWLGADRKKAEPDAAALEALVARNKAWWRGLATTSNGQGGGGLSDEPSRAVEGKKDEEEGRGRGALLLLSAAFGRLRVEPGAVCGAGLRYAFVEHWDFVVLGTVTGLAAGLIGIGGGLVMNAYMGAFRPDMPQHEVVATSLLVAVPIGLSGSLVHYRAGRIHARSCGLLAGCALLACGLTSRLVRDVDDSSLKKIFTAVLVGSALNMLRK